MTESRSDLRRLISSTGVYMAAGLAQQGVGFLLIPVYTRLIDPSEYGKLEILNAFASVVFACLTMGLSSAINKCYHRDCTSDAERASVLTTVLVLDVPVLVVAGAGLFAFAPVLSAWLVGMPGAAALLRLVVASGLCGGVVMLALANLRAQERATAFSVLTMIQFSLALGLNLLFVAWFGMGVRGILWGNLLSNAVVLPVALAASRHGVRFRFDTRLVRPLLSFGLYLIPVMLAGWVMDLSDRYVLRLFRDLDEVAVYGIGYKFGMVLQVALVWPFQLAWPAFSFAISRQPGHQATYARTLTYLTGALTFAVLLLSLGARAALPVFVGPAYRDAYRVVPLIAVAYALNGVQYCLSPGVHLAGRTRYLTLLTVLAAVINTLLNFALIPLLGMMGAAWSTALAFLFLAVVTGAVSQRVYPIEYEYARLAKAIVAGALVYLTATGLTPATSGLSLAWNLGMAVIAFPALLMAAGFLQDRERAVIDGFFRRYVLLFS